MFTMIVAILSMWIFRIGASVVIAKWLGFGVLGVWIAMTIDWFVRAIIFVIRYKYKIKKVNARFKTTLFFMKENTNNILKDEVRRKSGRSHK